MWLPLISAVVSAPAISSCPGSSEAPPVGPSGITIAGGGARSPAARSPCQGADVGNDDLGLTAGAAGALEISCGDIAEREHAGVPLDLERPGDLDRSVRQAGAGKVAAEVVADGSQPVAAKPDVGLDRAASDRRGGEGPKCRRLTLRLAGERITQNEIDASLLELAAHLVAELLLVGAGEDVWLGLENRDLLLRPAGVDLARELEPGRAGADDQDPLATRQLFVTLPIAVNGGGGVVCARLGGVGVARAGGEDDVVGCESSPRTA